MQLTVVERLVAREHGIGDPCQKGHRGRHSLKRTSFQGVYERVRSRRSVHKEGGACHKQGYYNPKTKLFSVLLLYLTVTLRFSSTRNGRASVNVCVHVCVCTCVCVQPSNGLASLLYKALQTAGILRHAYINNPDCFCLRACAAE